MSSAYSIEDHKHRLAAWAASRAASVKGCRFSVEDGVRILECAGFDARFSKPDNLPGRTELDSCHRRWREDVIAEAKNRNLHFTHGVAAKLINCYLKVRFVCGGHEVDTRVAALHPPIDGLMLKALAMAEDPKIQGRWKGFGNRPWSKLDSETYESLIGLIRQTVGAAPMWSIEEYWRGYQ